MESLTRTSSAVIGELLQKFALLMAMKYQDKSLNQQVSTLEEDNAVASVALLAMRLCKQLAMYHQSQASVRSRDYRLACNSLIMYAKMSKIPLKFAMSLELKYQEANKSKLMISNQMQLAVISEISSEIQLSKLPAVFQILNQNHSHNHSLNHSQIHSQSHSLNHSLNLPWKLGAADKIILLQHMTHQLMHSI